MDFSISPDMQALLSRVRDFVNKELIPLEAGFLNKEFNEIEPLLQEMRTKVREMGLLSPHMPKEHGGLGLSVMELGLMGAELGRSPIGHFVFNCQAPDSGNMEVLHKYANDEQKEKYLIPLVAGQIRSCFSMTEPDYPGSNPVWMGTTAEKDGDDYVINGRKWFTSAADGATFAIVMAVTDASAPPHMRASQIIVPMDTPGVEIVENTPCMGHRGEGWHSHSEIQYTNVRVPQENRLGPEGAGFLIAQERLGPGRIHHCMRWLGIAERSFELMCQRAVDRPIGEDRPLSSRQFVQGWVAESRAEIDSARLAVLHAAWKIDQVGAPEAREEIGLIKFLVANTMLRVVDRAIQMHGALGITDYTPLAFWYRAERAARIYDGADEVHKVSVAKRILKRFTPSAG
ncbi:MAG: acyl-CoA dehydrogenase [Candidatus Hydrogenedens sp.]|nr:acyl-CoA dehydrogenase [Candidatus Hydrogenedens sp.]